MVKARATLGSVVLLIAATPAGAQQADPPAAAPTAPIEAVGAPPPHSTDVTGIGATQGMNSQPTPPHSSGNPRTENQRAPSPSSPGPTPQPNVSTSDWMGTPSSPDYHAQGSGISEPLPPPEPESGDPAKMPDFSIRIDPLNWLLAGRLGFELETEIWKFITAEAIPVFVVDGQPPLLNLSSIPDTLHQESNGLGALAGGSLGAGFWLSGKPFQGTVLRFYGTNYAYKYVAKDNQGVIDSVKHTERYLVGMLGAHHKWGPFTIATGIGLGVEMNRDKRCSIDGRTTTKGCTDDEIVIGVQRPTATTPGSFTAVTGSFHPMYLLGRISLGFVL